MDRLRAVYKKKKEIINGISKLENEVRNFVRNQNFQLSNLSFIISKLEEYKEQYDTYKKQLRIIEKYIEQQQSNKKRFAFESTLLENGWEQQGNFFYKDLYLIPIVFIEKLTIEDFYKLVHEPSYVKELIAKARGFRNKMY